jgi:hypothetical protein
MPTNGVIRRISGGKLQINTSPVTSTAHLRSGAGATNVFGTAVPVAGSDGQTAFTVNGDAVTLTRAMPTSPPRSTMPTSS